MNMRASEELARYVGVFSAGATQATMAFHTPAAQWKSYKNIAARGLLQLGVRSRSIYAARRCSDKHERESNTKPTRLSEDPPMRTSRNVTSERNPFAIDTFERLFAQTPSADFN